MVEDFHGTAEALVFPDSWARLANTIQPDAALLLVGSYSQRDRGEEQAPFIVEAARPLGELRSSGAIGVQLAWSAAMATPNGRKKRRDSAMPAANPPSSSGAPRLCASQAKSSVITSYSIHYTKLYES